MAQERPNRLAEWLMLLRQNAPVAREQLKEWVGAVRQEPRLLWEMPGVRYFVYGAGGLIATWLVVLFVGLLTPPPPPGAREPAIVADFHVVCANPGCGYHFVIQRPFGFSGFPVVCDRCKTETGMPGRRCYSENCQGRWVAPLKVDAKQKCPVCGTFFPETP